MKKQHTKILMSLMIAAVSASMSLIALAETPLYKDSKQPTDARVKDLLGRMTLEEKVAQLETVWEKRKQLETDSGEFTSEHAKEFLSLGIGEVARPAENKKAPNKSVLQTALFTNAIQKWVLENTRLGIPVLFHEEALHGHAGRNSTSFPQAIGLASTWDPELVQQISSTIAQEVRVRGAQQVLAPILDVARDPRWGRIEETMGEDPYLIAAMGVSSVKGFQGGESGVAKTHVAATLKHLAGHGEPTGGLNTAPAPIGERGLREIFLFPFEAVVKLSHPRSVMASYNEIDGVPSHSNGKMLNGILRGEWGFDGLLVSDYFAINELVNRHNLAATRKDAALIAFNAGVDIETPDADSYPYLIDWVKEGKITNQQLDTAVARVLREKFTLGLFENPYVKTKGVDEFVGNPKHRALAQQAAEKTIVLLKNDKNILPLDIKKLKSIAVIGPHVNETLLGGYSDVPKQTVSILQGIKEYVGAKVQVNYAQGTLITLDKWTPGADSVAANSRSKERWNTDKVELATPADTKGMIEEAVAAAQKSDVALVVVGDNEATSREAWAENHLGDRTDLNLVGQQQELVDAVLATGKPTIVLLNNGRPLSITKIAATAPAILEGWYLGQETGRAVARVLFGDVNPGGKLPVSIARSVGHLPVYYNYKPAAKRGYEFTETTPLYPFGYGLSYTTFSYSNFSINKTEAKAGDSVDVSVTVTNTGARAGDEIVQLYTHDAVASLTRPVKELKGFKRINLKPKESTVVTFSLAVNQLGFYNTDMKYVVEPGKIEVMVGSSSQDIHGKGEFNVTGDVTDISQQKVYFSGVKVAKK
ncbi:beta-glucosidase [Cellvibrio zantedeschiae]|uniref:beta-glucosidase n=1 Tax=Cellvibrio zantedeschiae TaxID=1237077 RepID=A0ABQ3B665_9GAMM|nr:glycoside hydrolase family 3 N-terminal domain-containing protein [Cellvibrio zantedeschiae]GGY77525.1 beta-glucosidase [Cellvibrio zantedeschiae]